MNSDRQVLVLGASLKPERYSNRCILALRQSDFSVQAVGLRAGIVGDVVIQEGQPDLANIDTVTIYLGQQNQDGIKQYVQELKPRRVVFNPGAENAEFSAELAANGVEVENACSLVLLSLSSF